MNKRPGAAKTLAAQIEAAAEKVSSKLEGQAYSAKKTGVTSNDMSQAMMPYHTEAEDLLNLPGNEILVFNFVQTLARYSYRSLDMGASGYGERPSDEGVDILLKELAPRRRRSEPEWDFMACLKDLERQANNLAAYGTESCCSGTLELLRGWKAKLPRDSKLLVDTSPEKVIMPIPQAKRRSKPFGMRRYM